MEIRGEKERTNLYIDGCITACLPVQGMPSLYHTRPPLPPLYHTMNPIPMNNATPLAQQRFSSTEYAALYMEDTSPVDSTSYSPPPFSVPASTNPSSPQTPEFSTMTPQEEKPQLYWNAAQPTARRHQLEMTAAKLKALALAGQRRVNALEQENKHLKAALAGGIFRGFMQSYQKRFPQAQQQQQAPDFSAMTLSVTVMVNNQNADSQDWQGVNSPFTASHFNTTMGEIQQCMYPTDLQTMTGMGAQGHSQDASIPRDGYFSGDSPLQEQPNFQ